MKICGSIARIVPAFALLGFVGVAMANGQKDVIVFRLAFETAHSNVETVPTVVQGTKLFIAEAPALSGGDVQSAKAQRSPLYRHAGDGRPVPAKQYRVVFRMTKDGADKLYSLSKKHIGDYLVLVVNQEPILFARIMGELEEGVVVLEGLSKRRSEEIASYFR